MLSVYFRRALLISVIPAVLVLACSDSDDNPNQPPPSVNVTGTWTFDVTITHETGDCVGDNEPPWQATIDITQVGDAVTATGDWHSNPGTGPHEFGGTVSGNQLVLDGSYPEGTGTTLALYQLTVSADQNRMTGTETWTWTSATELCHDSQSTVVATRVAP